MITKKQRSFLFFLMVFLFIVIGPSIVFYSQGYRIDFQNKQLVQTGAFYFRISPRNAQIEISSLDNKKIKNSSTGVLFGTAYIENLIPRKYKIEVSKDNYYGWRKNLNVEEKRTTEIKNITLIPKNQEFEILFEEIENFFYFPRSNIFILKKQEKEGWNLLRKTERTDNFLEIFSSSPEEKLLDLDRLNNSNKIIIKTDKKGLIAYYLLDAENENDIINLNLPNKIKNISLHPEENKTIIFQESNEIFSYNYETKKTSSFLENVLDYSFDLHDNFYWLSDNGFLLKDIRKPEKVNRIPVEIKEGNEYKIIFPNFSEKILKINNDFHLLDLESSRFKKIFESKYEPVISPDLNKLLYSNGYDIKIIFLRKAEDQPRRNRLDDIFLTRYSEKIKNINWYTSHYLLFTISDQIIISEIDNRDNINIVNLAEFKNPKTYFNFYNKKLYVLSEKNLFVSEKLTP